ncbi:hypothetical protein ACHHYP_08791 [Achlya hypogyna]|uniref:Uncharacterized protein n=1 Tax=Achlya hypogyna TaxID=1202772 RepID=A0A1V9YP42_ACHHY|nr:hypothetical protein ACHHYP_08791 [Achlya hypogyna]
MGPSHAAATTATQPDRGRRTLATRVGGCGYIVASLIFSYYYLYLLASNINNDLWWPQYNLSGHEAYIVDVTNSLLQTRRSGEFDMFSPTMKKSFAMPTSSSEIYATYPRQVILTELTSLEYAVSNLRVMRYTWALRLNAPWCWVDFNRTFEVAHTHRRQERCRQRYWTNAAVYVEAPLRNVIWDDFIAAWGGPGNLFTIAIQLALEESESGRKWLQITSEARLITTIQDEVAYWRSYALETYELQWQNNWETGITETVKLENALGMQHAVTIKAIDKSYGPWTSENMYWMPMNDLWILQFLNASLVWGAPNHYLSLNQSLEYQNSNCNPDGTFSQPSAIFRDIVGPFVNIDCFMIRPPASLIAVYAAFEARHWLRAIPTPYPIVEGTMFPVPASWNDVQQYYGGNLLCISSAFSTSYVQQSFDFFDTCVAPQQLTVGLSANAMLFASILSTAAPRDVCQFDATASAACIHAVSSAHAAVTAVRLSDVDPSIVLDALGDVVTLNVSLMQYAISTSANWTILHQPLVTTDAAWTYVGGLFLYDWVRGAREVVAFEGDSGALVLVSNAYVAVEFGSSAGHMEIATRYVLYLVAATSASLSFVALLVFGFSVKINFDFIGDNLFFFNRIVGSVWIGRPLCLLRGVTAMCILSTASVSLIEHEGYTHLVPAPRSLFVISILAGEATWVSYVLSDVGTPCGRIYARLYAPGSCWLAWLVLVLTETCAPVVLVSTLDRTCSSQDYSMSLHCTSATIQIGSVRRFLLFCSLQAIIFVLAVVFAACHKKRSLGNDMHNTSLHLCGVSRLYLNVQDVGKEQHIDSVACVLSGLLPWYQNHEKYTFDIKTWRLYRDSSRIASAKALHRPSLSVRICKTNSGHLSRTDGEVTSLWRRRWDRAVASAGLGYITASLFGSLKYLELSGVSLANDAYWATFNSTGAHAFIATWLNEQLVLNTTAATAFRLDDPEVMLAQTFGAATTSVACVASFGTYVQHTQLNNSLVEAVLGIRATSASDAPWIFTPYCFLDLERRWEMANSAKRQLRCQAMGSNGAVFLETLLRNVEWNAWMDSWGIAFDTAVAHDLRLSQSGQQWLNDLSKLDQNFSPISEARYWSAHGVSTYNTQWQNYKQLGVINAYTVTNTYGIAYPFTLQSTKGVYRFASQTSWKMYWALANDLAAVATNGSGMTALSLLRSSPRFAFMNQSLQDVLVGNGTLASPLTNGYQMLSKTIIGPFGSVDMVYVAPPPDVKAAVAAILGRIRAALISNSAAREQLAMIRPSASMIPVPPAWTTGETITCGGSPLCPDTPGEGSALATGLLELVGFSKLCTTLAYAAATVAPTHESYVVAAYLAGIGVTTNLTRTCELDTANVASCFDSLNQAMNFLATVQASLSWLPVPLPDIYAQVLATGVSFMSYTQANSSMPFDVSFISVLNAPEFDFFGWIFLYDWIIGHREVISFQGDEGTLTLLSEYEATLNQTPLAWQVASNVAQYIHVGVYYVTIIMILVAGLSFVYAVASYGHCEGLNLLELSRVGGIVWIGRPLLLLRSLSALSLLSTGTLVLQLSDAVSYFLEVKNAWYKTILAASEVTWLVAVVNDVAMAVTQEYTAYYATFNSVLVMFITAIVSAVAPVGHSAVRNLECTYAQMDFQMVCESASIVVGSRGRYVTLVCVVLGCNAACYLGTLWLLRGKRRPQGGVHSLFLSSGAKHLYCHTRRTRHGVYYLDRPSGVLTGLLTLRWNKELYVFDIKIWRLVVLVDLETNQSSTASIPFERTIPLTD